MVAFRNPTAKHKRLTLISHYPFGMNQQPLSLKTRQTHSLPHSEHNSQRRVNDFYSYIMGNLGGDCMQTIINDVLPVFQRKSETNTLAAPF
jgi:hypothetical protein